ncbi:hypothetical protein GLOIN_2v1558015 [Rhizophagus irregularis DAOM 181602=DAOM 197198]|uniref:Uncharacterized protein n=1 Tax=Rhizophagus irregularis (strain DAOM 181602 / DAOM 197198 / MUCL 43194) TaxID=747089 RepID=A0A2P4QF46_RHIID|nr:hypothetical protein GLOIN_2v1558015 [Rhizophagus irregularis DAOM 181602=DAOM 197198]POG76261.1 hypothetical protein GLOIN_2v1558015 [Rhizophagus irregularis DAOM 181602=DAOM 197198]|eukprot:XP_025183127.1 hypothetical protein GLOIN_2v1558015 [Rhizophagus irregularis DAOM 181602=DAOM 197198]
MSLVITLFNFKMIKKNVGINVHTYVVCNLYCFFFYYTISLYLHMYFLYVNKILI